MEQFTASEVRDEADFGGNLILRHKMLYAYADRLEADEQAVPSAWMVSDDGWNQCFTTLDQCRMYGRKLIPLYTHPAPADAQRLAEAVRVIRQHVAKDPSALAASIIATCDEALAAHSTQAQPPAASVTDAMQELADKYHELLWAVARKFPGETRHETALRYIRAAECQEATLAAQENPNGV